MPPSFAHCWLLPRLADLLAELPDVDLRVNAQGGHLQGDRTPFQQLADAPADVQNVYGDKDIWADRAEFLVAERFHPSCAQAFLKQHEIAMPEKLPMQRLITTAQNVLSWDECLNMQGVARKNVGQ